MYDIYTLQIYVLAHWGGRYANINLIKYKKLYLDKNNN